MTPEDKIALIKKARSTIDIPAEEKLAWWETLRDDQKKYLSDTVRQEITVWSMLSIYTQG